VGKLHVRTAANVRGIRPAGVTLGLLAAGLLPAAHGAGAAGTVRVILRPIGATSVAQGNPFGIRAVAQNSDPAPVDVQILFTLRAPDGASVPFFRWSARIPGSGQAKASLNPVTSQWFPQTGTFRVLAGIQGIGLAGSLDLLVTPPTIAVPLFRDVTVAAGLDTTLPRPTCLRMGNGAAWGDVEGDGDPDLYVPLPDGPGELWMNDGAGHFTDEAVSRAVDNRGRIGMGAVFADYDNDGDEDLYVVNDGSNRLYQNDGAGHFSDVSSAAGVADGGSGPSASWGDYDNDGNLDLFVVNNRNCDVPIQADRLYHNEGDGTFSDQTALLELDGTTDGAGFEASWVDVDGDGDQDLYLVTDRLVFNQDTNHLWRNDGDGVDGWLFTDISAESGAGFVMHAMGTAVGDFDRDLDMDFAMSNIGRTVLARNNGDGTFTDVASTVRVDRPRQSANLLSITWGMEFADLNLDGWSDLYVSAGKIYTPDPQANALFVADGAGRFLDLSAPSGAADPSQSRGLAVADYDGDGLVDLYVVNQDGHPHLYRNVTPAAGSHWLEIDTIGRTSNRDGCGARLTLSMGGVKLLREVLCGSTSVGSGADSIVHFGLGSASTVDWVEILWPSGADQLLTGVAADQLLTVMEPA
jgi:enediyne biosynthesis protein E4